MGASEAIKNVASTLGSTTSSGEASSMVRTGPSSRCMVQPAPRKMLEPTYGLCREPRNMCRGERRASLEGAAWVGRELDCSTEWSASCAERTDTHSTRALPCDTNPDAHRDSGTSNPGSCAKRSQVPNVVPVQCHTGGAGGWSLEPRG